MTFSKPLIIATLAVATAGVGLTTRANADPLAGALIGGAIGAAIGHDTHHRNGAAVGGVLGAIVGSSIASDRYYDRGYYDRGYYGRSYYAPAPVYVAPAPVYYGPSIVYRSGPSYGYRHARNWDRPRYRGHRDRRWH